MLLETILIATALIGSILIWLFFSYRAIGGGGLIPSVEIMVLLRNGKMKPIEGQYLRDSRGGYYDMATRQRIYPQELR